MSIFISLILLAFCVSVSATTTQVSSGDDTLITALSDATAGDVLVM